MTRDVMERRSTQYSAEVKIMSTEWKTLEHQPYMAYSYSYSSM